MREKRITVLSISILVVFLALVLRLSFLQLWKGEKYRTLARQNYIKPDIIEAPRGIIYDRNGVILADNIPSYTIIIDSILVTGQEYERIYSLLGHNRIGAKKYRLRNVPFDVVCKIEEKREEFPAISIRPSPLRRYPYGEKFSHVIGYTAEISNRELKTLSGYRLGASVGKAGIEKQYEEFLKGKDGARYIEVDAKCHEVGLLSYVGPVPGYTVWLNIDARLQELAYQLLPEMGACLVMEPGDGKVLVWMSKPGFDPNLFSGGISSRDWELFTQDTIGAPLLNRGLNPYPPASVFKLVTCAAAVEKGIVNRETRQAVSCEGSMMIGRREFGCWETHGSLNLIDAIIHSCDVYFYQLGMSLGVDAIYEKAKGLMLLEKAGVDLPNERGGFVASRKWYDEKYGKNRWGKGVAANLAVGQGEIMLTPIQILHFISGIAAKGTLCMPRIISKVVSSAGEEIFRSTPKYKELKIEQEALEIIREGMLGVVEDEEGTGRLARVSGIRMAGKTGSAENPRGETHAWFVGFAPYENPQICIVVLVEHGGMGGSVSAPIAKEIIEKYLELNRE